MGHFFSLLSSKQNEWFIRKPVAMNLFSLLDFVKLPPRRHPPHKQVAICIKYRVIYSKNICIFPPYQWDCAFIMRD